jgi:hypothetical protein
LHIPFKPQPNGLPGAQYGKRNHDAQIEPLGVHQIHEEDFSFN